MTESVSPKSSGGGFAVYYSKNVSGSFKAGSSKGGSEFDTFSRINTEHVSGYVLLIFPRYVRAIPEKNCDRRCGR